MSGRCPITFSIAATFPASHGIGEISRSVRIPFSTSVRMPIVRAGSSPMCSAAAAMTQWFEADTSQTSKADSVKPRSSPAIELW